ncbi:MAG: glycerophosphodiester phosphodiesterase family protein [Bacteroidaceae bacterium]|nr:glycerophosphodiester phosphodiesterase family protein [Bacteroidaceae bacterium]
MKNPRTSCTKAFLMALLMAVPLTGLGQSMFVHTKSMGSIRIPISEIDSVSIADQITGSYYDVDQFVKPFFVPDASMINWRYGDIQMVCHRAYNGYPENTYVGIAKAVEMGYKMIECDIAFTKDDVAILSHDATLERCSNGTGRTTDYTLEELQQFDFGSWAGEQFAGERVCTLESILQLCKANNVVLELDCATKARFPNTRFQQVYDLVKSYGMLGSTIWCDNIEPLRILLDIDPNLIVSISSMTSTYQVDRGMEIFRKARITDCSVPFAYLSENLVKYIHSKGMYVKTWTVDEVDDVKWALKIGCDHILSNTIGPELPAE